MKYKAFTLSNIEEGDLLKKIPSGLLHDLKVVGTVLPRHRVCLPQWKGATAICQSIATLYSFQAHFSGICVPHWHHLPLGHLREFVSQLFHHLFKYWENICAHFSCIVLFEIGQKDIFQRPRI